MIDIEQLSNILSQSQPFKKLITQQVKLCFEERQIKTDHEDETPLPLLTKQIASQLLEITQLVLEEQNNHNYMSLMKNNQELCIAIEKKIELEFEEKIDALNKRIEELSHSFLQNAFNAKKSISNSHSQSLNQQRKTITKSILDYSRIGANTKTKSSITPRQTKQIRFEYTEEQQKLKQMIETNYSRSNPSLEDNTFCDQQSTQYRSILVQSRKNAQEIDIRLTKIEKSFVELSQKLQFKLESNLQGLWNVLGDLNARLAKFQTGQSVALYGE